MGKTIMGVAAVSLDGFIADDKDNVGPLFVWLGNGDVSWSLPGGDVELMTCVTDRIAFSYFVNVGHGRKPANQEAAA